MKNDTFCPFDDRRDDALVSYLYDEMTVEERRAFDAHLPDCVMCRSELAALADVRADLAAWASPEPVAGVGGKTPRVPLRLAAIPPPDRWATPRVTPRWLQAAAAVLLFAAGVGLGNLRVSYSNDGLVLRTGWAGGDAGGASRPASAVTAERTAVTAPAVQPAAPWRDDLAALEQQLRDELAAQRQAVAASAPEIDDLLRRVRALIAESEQRQQRELALRVAEVARETQVQRQADLVKIERSLGLIQSRTGVEVMRTQQQLNSLAQRVSQRP
jgi:anti-sigma factor RsiW